MLARGWTTARARASAGVGVVGGDRSYERAAGPAVAIPRDAVAASRGGGTWDWRIWWNRKRRRRRAVGMMSRMLGRLQSAPRMLVFFSFCAVVIFLLLHGGQQRDRGQTPTHMPSDTAARLRHPSVTIFAAPRPVASSSSLVGRRQELAVRSWLALSPRVLVVLFGKHPSIYSFATALGPRVSVESAVDFTFLGTPFFHTMVARSQASHTDVSVLIDPETLLFPNFITALYNVMQLRHDWLIVSVPRSVSNFSFHLDDNGSWWLPKRGKTDLEKLQENLGQRYCKQHSGGILMAWNKGNVPLHGGTLPPFIYGKGFHNQWIINEALSSEFRVIIDANAAFLNVYPETLVHENQLLNDSGSNHGDHRTWETDGNSHLAAVYGSIFFRRNKSSNLMKLVVCWGKYFFINAAGDRVYFSDSLYQQRSGSLRTLLDEDHSNLELFKNRLFQPMVEKRWRTCLDYNRLQYMENKCSVSEFLKINFTSPPSLMLPFSFESLLQMNADEHKTIVLSVAGDSYRDMLMSWVCRLRHLSVSNFIIGALDSNIYQFSVLQGLPVFKDPLAPKNISTDSCHFGSECFQHVTKVKSRLALQILKLGYNVLLSDVDVYWFQNPLPYLHSFGPATFLAQSDEYNETGPINLPRRLNSGFYFARSDTPTISAMEKVVIHASTSKLSEQPSFYDVLCGEGGINRVSDNQCVEPETNLTVTFLDRNLFPNGAFKGLWEKHDVEAACQKEGCLILHNNWISGRMKKLKRQVLSGLWAYNTSSRMCLHHWKLKNS